MNPYSPPTNINHGLTYELVSKCFSAHPIEKYNHLSTTIGREIWQKFLDLCEALRISESVIEQPLINRPASEEPKRIGTGSNVELQTIKPNSVLNQQPNEFHLPKSPITTGQLGINPNYDSTDDRVFKRHDEDIMPSTPVISSDARHETERQPKIPDNQLVRLNLVKDDLKSSKVYYQKKRLNISRESIDSRSQSECESQYSFLTKQKRRSSTGKNKNKYKSKRTDSVETVLTRDGDHKDWLNNSFKCILRTCCIKGDVNQSHNAWCFFVE